MSGSQDNPEIAEKLPRARVRKTRWSFPVVFVWVVPLVAVIVAGYVIYDRVREIGPKITIKFSEVNGVKTGQTQIKYRGVPVGEVTQVDLSENQQHALVTVRLRRSGASIAREGSVFWIVRPEVGAGTITGLGTVITGPEIGVLPGTGKAQSDFVGLESSPAVAERKGLKIVLLSSHLKSLKANSPVYYRGIEVGAVQDARLNANATAAEIHVVIRQRYANLVRDGSKFWNVSGVDASIGLFSGVQVNVESLRSLVAGGIALATPNDPSARPVKDGTVFRLYEKPDKKWLGWAPKIPIPPEK